MIYKFIDNNGSEITVNSLSSLQALVDSETVKKNTKVKAGLRGKWTTAESISDLVFEENKEEHIPEEIIEPEEDIKSFLTKEENKKTSKKKTTKKEEVEETSDEQEEEEIKDIDEKEEEDTQEEHDEEKTDYDIEEKRDKTYDDENVIGLNFFESIGTCLKKYFVFKGRASRSEYWFFQLLFTVISIPALIFENTTDDTYIIFVGISGIIILLLLIPALAVTVRRFHDINKSGWFVLFQIIPFIGWIIILVMLIEKGTEGKNRFGDYPLKLKKNNK